MIPFNAPNHWGGTVAPEMALGLPSLLIMVTMFGAISGWSANQSCDPTSPFSSAAKRIMAIERFGAPPASLMRRMASIPGETPDISSTPPVPPSKESKCPPRITYSSG